MIRPEWACRATEAAPCEVLVFDGVTRELIEWNEAAAVSLGLHAASFGGTDAGMARRLRIESIVGGIGDPETFLAALQSTGECRLPEAALLRNDGSSCPTGLRVIYHSKDGFPVYIVVGQTPAGGAGQTELPATREAHYRAILASTPGLFFQMLYTPDGTIAFPYLSEGCHALLGVEPEALQANPALFASCILPEDLASYRDTMGFSASGMTAWNWEGRLRIVEWNDIKWINLRAMPREMPCGGVQWDGIMTNITQGREEQAELARSREQLARLGSHVEQVKEEERKRIARELHDDLGGNLTAIKMALALLTRRLPPDQPQMADKAAYLDQLIDRTIDAVHRIAGNLRPSVLDIGIVDAIQWQAGEFEKQVGISCTVHSSVADIDLAAEESTALFRIFQEALTNVGKHAHASRVVVTLQASAGDVRLTVADNGRGLSKQARRSGSFGILGMEERANALGGALAIYNSEEGGCVVSVLLPLRRSVA